MIIYTLKIYILVIITLIFECEESNPNKLSKHWASFIKLETYSKLLLESFMQLSGCTNLMNILQTPVNSISYRHTSIIRNIKTDYKLYRGELGTGSSAAEAHPCLV